VNPNDTGDADSGPNELQNFPDLKSATYLSTSTVIAGSLNSKPNTTYTLQFYANYSDCDPGGLVELGIPWLCLQNDRPKRRHSNFAFQVATQIPRGDSSRPRPPTRSGTPPSFPMHPGLRSRQDDDGDGLPNVIENLGPNGGDGNGDGIPDSQQPNVATTLSPTGQDFITMVTSGGCNRIQDIQSLAETPVDSLFDYPSAC